MINFWRPFKYIKPKEPGSYLCTVMHGKGENQPVVMELYYSLGGNWINKHRKNVFDGYKVYASTRAPIDSNRVWVDYLCERIDVVAWKKMPKVYKRGNK